MVLKDGYYIMTNKPLYLEDEDGISLVAPNVEGLVRLTPVEFYINTECNPDIWEDDWYKVVEVDSNKPKLVRLDVFKKYATTHGTPVFVPNSDQAMEVVRRCKDTELACNIRGIPDTWWEWD